MVYLTLIKLPFCMSTGDRGGGGGGEKERKICRKKQKNQNRSKSILQSSK